MRGSSRPQDLDHPDGRGRAAGPTAIDWIAAGPWWRLVVVGALALALGVGLVEFLSVIKHVLALVLASIVIAAALSPFVGWLDRRLPRGLAVALVYLALFLLVGLAGWFLLPRLIGQALMLINALPQLFEGVRGVVERFDLGGTTNLAGFIQARLRQFLGPLTTLPLTLATYITEIILIVSMSAYWLLAAPAVDRFFVSLFPARHRRRIDTLTDEMGATMGGYVRGVVIDAAIIGALVFAGLWVIGVEYTLVLAVFAGLTEVVPIIGPIVGAVPAIGIALLDSPTQALTVLAFFVVVQEVESNLVTPFVMRSQTDITPVLTLLALLVGGAIGGIFWALVAIPAAGALRVIVLHLVAPAIRRWTGAPGPDAAVARRDEARQEVG